MTPGLLGWPTLAPVQLPTLYCLLPTLTLIHRAEYLGPLLDVLKDRFGGLTIYPLFPKCRAPAARVIVQGRKNSRAHTRLLPGLVLHQQGGAYTSEAEAILRNGAALYLA